MTSKVKKTQEKPIIILEENMLWNKFNNNINEMILTKKGRRMFPTLKIKVVDLDPKAQYSLSLEFLPVDNYRYKYSKNSGWSPTENENKSNIDQLIYSHPDSPNLGSKWMSQKIGFGGLKLTNNSKPCTNNFVVLTSMQKYQPRIILQKHATFKNIVYTVHKIFVETSFIAVTAYQNHKITDLKIYNNPFAKGFRQRAKKRKSFEKSDSEKEENSKIIVNDQTNQKAITNDKISFSIDNILASTNCPLALKCCCTNFRCATYNMNFLNLYSPHRALENARFSIPSNPFPVKVFSNYTVDAILKT